MNISQQYNAALMWTMATLEHFTIPSHFHACKVKTVLTSCPKRLVHADENKQQHVLVAVLSLTIRETLIVILTWCCVTRH